MIRNSKSSLNSIPLQCSFDLEPLRKFVLNRVLPGAAEREERNDFPVPLYEELHRLGFLHAYIPTSLGGLGASSTDMACVLREIGYGSAGIATSMAADMAAVVPFLFYASPSLRQPVLDQLSSGLSLSSFCFTEPDAGSDVLRIRTKAIRSPGGYVVSGHKCFITNANIADRFLVVARTSDASQPGFHPKNALSVFCVPAGTRGLSTGSPNKKLGQSDSNNTEVFLEDVFVPEANRIGNEGDALKIAVHSLQRSRTMFAAAAVGLALRALDLAEAHLRSRVLYEKPLISQPAIRHILAQLHTEVQAAWYLTCASAAAWDNEMKDLVPSSMAKLYCGQIAVKVANATLELFGGWGYMKEYEIERLYRDAKLFELIEGPTLVQQAILSKELFPEFSQDKRRAA